MRKFKLYDYWISLILIIAFTIISLIKRDGTFIAGYFTVGAWQLVSMLVHYQKKWFMAGSSARSIYQKCILGLALCSIVGCIVPLIGMFIFFILLFISPLLAIIYTAICYNEVFVKMQRPLALLK